MRTTINIDEDLAQVLRQEADAKRRPFTEILNGYLRDAIARKTPPREPFRVQTFPGKLAPGIDPDRLNRLNDELEDELVIERLRRELDRP